MKTFCFRSLVTKFEVWKTDLGPWEGEMGQVGDGSYDLGARGLTDTKVSVSGIEMRTEDESIDNGNS